VRLHDQGHPLISDFSERDVIIEGFRRGTHGVISHDELSETLRERVRAVHQGQTSVRAEALRFLVEAIVEMAASSCGGENRRRPRPRAEAHRDDISGKTIRRDALYGLTYFFTSFGPTSAP